MSDCTCGRRHRTEPPCMSCGECRLSVASPDCPNPGNHVCSKCGTAGCLEDANSGWYDQ